MQVSFKDVYETGMDQVVLENDHLEVVVVPEVGGRIAEMTYCDTSLLHRTYPDAITIGPYVEYGGIEECVGSAPGTVWNVPWKCDEQDDGVILSAYSRDVLVQKVLTLSDDATLGVRYKFTNVGETFSKFTFGVHPEISVGRGFKTNVYYLLPKNRQNLERGEYSIPGIKKFIRPEEGWCAVADEEVDVTFGMVFPEETVDRVEIYYPRIDSHMVVELLIDSVGLSPGTTASFTMFYHAQKGSYDGIRQFFEEAKEDKQIYSDYRELFERSKE